MSTPAEEKNSADKTMAQLWASVRQRGDLPGFSKVVKLILAAMRDGDENGGEFNMTRTVLSDPALTQRVLKLANSAMYAVFGQDVNTVSKAVVVLGTEAIGHLALGLKLVDSLSQASAESESARSEMEKAVLAGHIARQVAGATGSGYAEEAVVCTVLHAIGRMMVAFYLPDRWQQMQARSAETGVRMEEVAVEVLGLAIDEVGRLAAKRWGFPASLIETLQEVPPRAADASVEHVEWMAAVATLSSRCAETLRAGSDTAAPAIAQLASGYAGMLGLESGQILDAIDTGLEAMTEEGMVLAPEGHRFRGERRAAPVILPGKPAHAAALLTRGIAEMRSAARTLSTGQLLTMALETVYQGLGFSRAMVFLHDRDRGQYDARMCFGEGVQELLPQLVFGAAYQPDVFHAALVNDKIVFVENAQTPSFMSKVPQWWKTSLPTVRSFLILPLIVHRQPMGFIYGDWDLASPAARIEAHEIEQLNELRLMIVHEVGQRRQAEPSSTKRVS